MRAVFAVAALAMLAGCAAGGGQVQPSPQGIGSSPNQLRRAPCACVEVKSLPGLPRSEEHTSELQSLMRISYAVFCLTKKKTTKSQYHIIYLKQLRHTTI